MKKVKSSVALFLRTHLSAPGANKNKKVESDYPYYEFTEAPYLQLMEYKAPPLKTTRKFKIVLISAYTFLISLFGAIVYAAIILDPKFPF